MGLIQAVVFHPTSDTPPISGPIDLQLYVSHSATKDDNSPSGDKTLQLLEPVENNSKFGWIVVVCAGHKH